MKKAAVLAADIDTEVSTRIDYVSVQLTRQEAHCELLPYAESVVESAKMREKRKKSC